jgi:hypothetical protein
MIIYLGEAERWKTARTELPNTAEFEPLRDALKSKDRDKKELLAAAAAELDRAVDAHPATEDNPIVPDNLYETTMGDSGLLKRWESTFGEDDKAEKLFGLLAWQYFFNHDSKWRAQASDTPGLGKLGWSYHLESEEPAVSFGLEAKPAEPEAAAGQPERHDDKSAVVELPTEAAGLVLNQCVFWKTQGDYGRIVAKPRQSPTNFLKTQQSVRFAPARGEPVDQRQKWINTENLEVAHQDNCKQIEPAE